MVLKSGAEILALENPHSSLTSVMVCFPVWSNFSA